MAFAGLKKQINKANQYVTEKMGGAEGTKLDLDFMEMERKTDVTVELVEELQAKTKEYLQPNPTARAKMAAVKGISKLSGQAKSNTYPQPEGILADCMLTYGKKLGEDSIFANALVEMGDSLKQMADVKYSLDDNIKQNFLEPLHQLQTKDLKEVMHHRKKLQGRRLDFDCKKRRQAKDEEVRGAEEKFAESLQLAQVGMYNLLENDVEQVSQLVTFAEGLLDFHQQCADILRVLVEVLNEKREEAAARPKSEFVPKTLADLNIETLGSQDGMNGGTPFLSSRGRLKNSHHHMYSSQQNLSTHNNNNNNNHNSGQSSNNNNNNSNFNRNKLYGSQQSLASTRSGGSGLAGNTGGGGGPNGNNSFLRPPSYGTTVSGGQHVSTVDNWLNAWDQPSPVKPAAAAASAASNKFNSNSNNNGKASVYNNNSQYYSSSTTTTTTTSRGAAGVGAKFPNKSNFSDPWSASPLPSPMRSPARTPMPAKPAQPCCTALYDFEPENPGELGFKENDVITLIQRVDENWFEGSVNGRTGYFPQSYVQVTVPFP
ncbi:endophilin-A isoform X2 [Culex pipiens pallens]|uniref:endophilin-A isoform X2 n=1 Tax=Culex pipiens pallens TaxID=42434 RepID=UPI0022AB30A2|nr:endophilin-A isoform X2 [Culex pipiens pallens]